jgi:hypothetical protein
MSTSDDILSGEDWIFSKGRATRSSRTSRDLPLPMLAYPTLAYDYELEEADLKEALVPKRLHKALPGLRGLAYDYQLEAIEVVEPLLEERLQKASEELTKVLYDCWLNADRLREFLPLERLRKAIPALSKVVFLNEARQKAIPALEAKFRQLADAWRRETMADSSITRAAMNPNYQRIIGMGPAALPIILKELRDRGGHWYWALRMISGEDPVPEHSRGKVREMRQHWLDWGHRRGSI